MDTRLTQAFRIDHPILLAPMAIAGGGRLAAAVTQAGGLGLIGGGYCDPDWIEAQFKEAGNASVGCGFITWRLADQPGLLTSVLARQPAAIFLSFGDPMRFAEEIAAAEVPLICQVQTLKDAKRAAEAGADVIVAQGAEAGGHGERRATMTLVPEVVDWVTANAPETLVVAAGGIADGRGLAAALMLGADGVLVGSRLWASQEALVSDAMVNAAIESTGDDTIRSTVMDKARLLNWPDRFTCRVLENAFTRRWHNDLDGLIAHAEEEAAKWQAGFAAGDPELSNTFVGEATGLIHDRPPAGELIERMMDEAKSQLSRFA